MRGSARLQSLRAPQAGQRSGLMSESGIGRVRHFHAIAVTASLSGLLHRMIGPRQQDMQGVISMYGGGTDVFLGITQANCGSGLAREGVLSVSDSSLTHRFREQARSHRGFSV